MAGKIFINYRRDDSIGMAGRLHDRLAQTFGRDKLFMDVDHIPVGEDFVTHLNNQVAECDVVLVVIGPGWLRAKDKAGQRRLQQPDDFVAIEIAAALARNIRVIPVLVDGARMPKESELPDSLKPLARRQAAEVRHSHFGRDAESLIASMREAVPGLLDMSVHESNRASVAPRPWRRKSVAAATVAAALVLIGVGAYAFIQTAVEKSVQRSADNKVEQKPQARAAAEAEAMRKADEAERQRLAALKADQERQGRAEIEAETKRKTDEAERQRLADLKTDQEQQARAAAEAEAKRKADEAEQQRLAALKADEQRRRDEAPTAPAPPTNGGAVLLPQTNTATPTSPDPVAVNSEAVPIGDAVLLNELRDRLYELNFDPGALYGPLTDANRKAIREFQQQINVPPTGAATLGLLRRLRELNGLRPWASIVFNKDTGKWGMAWDESTRKSAVARARISCGDLTACPVEVSFFGTSCGAFAHSRANWAISARDDIGKARAAALADCGRHGKSCQIVAAVCANGAERFSAK